MYKVKIRESLKAGWDSFARRPLYLLGVMLAYVGIFLICSGDALFTALAYIAYGGFIALLIKHYRGEHVVFDDMFSLDRRWISFAFLAIIKTFLVLLGFALFIIPGIYLSIRWMFADMLVIDQDMRPIEALRASSKMTKDVKLKLFLFGIVVFLLMTFSVFVFVIGVFVAALVVSFAYIKLYEDLKGKLLDQAPEMTEKAPDSSEAIE